VRRFIVAVAVVLMAAGCSTSPDSANSTPDEADLSTLEWGERFTWDDGLAVEISAPQRCTPGEAAFPNDVTHAVKVAVTVFNGTSEEFNSGQFAVGNEAQFASMTVSNVNDSGGPCGPGLATSGTVAPGREFAMEWAVVVTDKAGELQLVLQPTINAKKAIYLGQVPAA
jgi:hypothetical protein